MLERSNIPLFDDNPTTTDRLGFSALIELTVDALTRPDLDPVCVGVTGPWGSGKSSIAQQVKEALCSQEDVLVTYVEPWAFDPSTDPKAHLIGDVLNAISQRVNENDSDGTFKVKLKGLLGRVRWTRAAQLAATTALTAQLPSIDNLAEVFGSNDDEVIEEPSIDGFRNDFAELVSHDQMKELRRVVVVVDDLDRCLSDTVIAVLEAIKLFLSVPKMAFLVAADETAVKNAISVRYGNEPGAVNLAERYLDKIVQIPVRVPVLDRVTIEAYILQLLALGTRDDRSDEADSALRKRCDVLRHEPISTLAERPLEGVDPAHVEMAQRLAPLLHVGLDGNPRRVKRFLNEMGQREHLARSRGIDIDRAAVAKLMVLEQVHPNEFGRLLGWVRSDELEPRLATIEDDEDAAGSLADWHRTSPNIDADTVRRYVLLAASLKGEVVAVHALPEHLREKASALLSSDGPRRARARRGISTLAADDAIQLGRYVAQAIRSQPNLQPDHAESLGQLAQKDEAVADTIAAEIARMPADKVDPVLVYALAPPRSTISKSILATMAAWQDSGQLSTHARKATAQRLDPTKE